MIERTKELYTQFDGQYPTLSRIGRYLISGGTALGTDLALLYVFTDIFNIWYLTSAILAFILAFIVSFMLQKYWTFQDHSRDGLHMQMGVYFLVAVINLSLNTLLVYVFVEWMSAHYLFAQMFASALIAIESFFVYQRFIFKKTSAV